MSKVDLATFRGEEFQLGGVATKNGVGYPPGSVAGYILKFTAKRRLADTAPVVQKDSVANAGDVTIATGGAWTVAIRQADTSGFTVAELLAYDVTLVEPDGTKTVLDYGTWKVARGVG